MFRKTLFLSAIATSSILFGGIAQAQAQSLFAVVNSNGSLARGLGAVSSRGTGLIGNYEVIFNRDVRNCAYVATIGRFNTGVAAPGEITVASRGGNNNGVFLTLKDSAGNRRAEGFHLVVTCPN
jgi:hypothetical protein